MDEIKSVGVREFRANLHKYTRQTQNPIAITSRGEPIGYFIPAKPAPDKQDLIALREAARKLYQLLEATGVDEDDIIQDFQNSRRSE